MSDLRKKIQNEKTCFSCTLNGSHSYSGMSLFDKISELQGINTLSKHEHLVNGINNAIDDKILNKGDQLPSINIMVKKLGYARKTIVKAYEDLKSRGIVESKQFKGYFILSEETHQVMRVGLILYAFHSFQETFYNTFRNHLNGQIQLDVFFHHNNPDIFESILSNIDKKYGMYVIAPIQSPKAIERLKQIPPEKLLIVDRYVNLGKEYSYIAQEFEDNTFEKLTNLLPEIRKYEEFTLFFRDNIDHPRGIKKGFLKFLKTNNIKGSVCGSYKRNTLKKNHLYFFISDNDLFQLIKDCKKESYSIGKEVGIISHNESLLKEVIGEGITTISADFQEMADLSANFILQKRPIQAILPTHLIKRNSL